MARTQSADVRERILEAAEARLWHYGFKKTTIDEIAADAGVGKGTVYLYFDGKEDLALAIVAQYKIRSIEQVEAIVRDARRDPIDKLREALTYPIVNSHRRCADSPAALEMIVAVRPHILARMRPYIEQEIALIAEILEEGNGVGVFDVPDAIQAARTLKYMTTGFLPPYPCVQDIGAVGDEIRKVVDLAVRGLRKCAD